MNLKEAKIMLEKINRLYESMILDSKIDPFEQELMLSYIKKLYVTFSENGDSLNIVSQSKPEVKAAAPVVKPSPRVIKRVVVDAPKPVVPVPPEVITDPEEIEMMEEAAIEVVAPTPAPKPKPTPRPTPKTVTVRPAAKTATISEDIAELFDDEGGKELSDRLASLPIRDLTKAMGINERILTVNELFGKNQEDFTTSMNIMNTMGSFEEAKVFLVECAKKYGWADGGKVKKAKIFIKLVRRRYK